jgi:hypothetical protein
MTVRMVSGESSMAEIVSNVRSDRVGLAHHFTVRFPLAELCEYRKHLHHPSKRLFHVIFLGRVRAGVRSGEVIASWNRMFELAKLSFGTSICSEIKSSR